MKSILYAFLFTLTCCKADDSGQSKSASNYGSIIAAYIKKEQFNLELYELSFCASELLQIIERDSVYRKSFEKRINRAFDKRLNEAQIYFHALEYEFLRKQIMGLENVQQLYPKSTSLIERMAPRDKPSIFKDFSIPFQNYIEYPDQTDDACLITLISNLPKNALNEIQSNKLAMYRFNTWLEYGFEELRFYPGTKSAVKSEINSRIVRFLNQRLKLNTEPLATRSLKAINAVAEKYKSKK